jgi:hypothetical protein
MKRLLSSKINLEDDLSKSPKQLSRPASCRKDSSNKLQNSEQRKSLKGTAIEVIFFNSRPKIHLEQHKKTLLT